MRNWKQVSKKAAARTILKHWRNKSARVSGSYGNKRVPRPYTITGSNGKLHNIRDTNTYARMATPQKRAQYNARLNVLKRRANTRASKKAGAYAEKLKKVAAAHTKGTKAFAPYARQGWVMATINTVPTPLPGARSLGAVNKTVKFPVKAGTRAPNGTFSGGWTANRPTSSQTKYPLPAWWHTSPAERQHQLMERLTGVRGFVGWSPAAAAQRTLRTRRTRPTSVRLTMVRKT